jgi:bis(5'-nucleosyl)-tetraphosphatase (symmetrical)
LTKTVILRYFLKVTMMKTYAIGDVQGCFFPLQNVIRKIEEKTPNARYLFAGDLVERGPHSLEVLRFVRDLGNRAVAVLGNHDLHLLALAAGVRKKRSFGMLEPIFHAPDFEELIYWLRHRPLVHDEKGTLLVHAGVLPQWTFAQTKELAKEVEAVLQGPDWVDFMHQMYGDEPSIWSDDLKGAGRLRCIINAFTRLRFCTEEGEMEFDAKNGVDFAPYGYVPWFEVKKRKTQNDTIVFGHWSMLGLYISTHLIGLDTGCTWGKKLTAVCLEDRQVFQADCRCLYTLDV